MQVIVSMCQSLASLSSVTTAEVLVTLLYHQSVGESVDDFRFLWKRLVVRRVEPTHIRLTYMHTHVHKCTHVIQSNSELRRSNTANSQIHDVKMMSRVFS